MDEPASPRTGEPEPLAAALLPVLLHRIRNTTQLLTGLNALFDLGDTELPPARAGDLASASDEAGELGWLLGVIAGGLGADLLLERRERTGLGTMLLLVRDGLRRENEDLGLPQACPELTPEAPAHGALVWLAADLAWCGARGRAAASLVFEQAAGQHVLRIEGGGPLPAPERFAACLELLPGARLDPGGGGGEDWRLVLPAPWFRDGVCEADGHAHEG